MMLCLYFQVSFLPVSKFDTDMEQRTSAFCVCECVQSMQVCVRVCNYVSVCICVCVTFIDNTYNGRLFARTCDRTLRKL